MVFAVVASVLLGAVMTVGDWAWAALHFPHRVAYGITHGAVMCLCVGLAVGIRAGTAGARRRRRSGDRRDRRPVVLCAGAGDAVERDVRCVDAALDPVRACCSSGSRRRNRCDAALLRGTAAAVLSGAMFYAISGIWIHDSHTDPNLLWHFGAWSIAFVPGFVALFFNQRRR